MSGFTHYAHPMHAEDALESSPLQAPEPPRPWWRRPILVTIQAVIVVVVGATLYALANRPPEFDLLATPACVDGHYELSWTTSMEPSITQAELRRPAVADPRIALAEDRITLTVSGEARGDVWLELVTEDGRTITAGSNGALTGGCR